MKTTLTLFISMFIMYVQIEAQVVTQDVNFDYYLNAGNNDFVNHFSVGTGLNQILSGGITGGCLSTPDSINWGNDNAIFCTRYHPSLGDTTITGICFKYDSTTVNLSSFQRAISIFISPYADFNHYVIATVSGNKQIELLTYGWSNNPYPNLNLLHNHWYSYKLSVAFIGGAMNDVYIKAEVFDLGLSGTAAPVLVNSSSGSINDNILVNDTSIQVSITGTSYGGAAYLDNFHFHGGMGVNNCLNVGAGIKDPASLKPLMVYISPGETILHIIREVIPAGKMEITIFNPEGKKLVQFTSLQMKTDVDIASLANGVYMARCKTGQEVKNYKIYISK